MLELKPFQEEGFEYVKNLDSFIIAWSTGTGKSVLTISLSKHYLESGLVDKICIVSKNHNKTNWGRIFEALSDLSPVIIDTDNREERTKLYTEQIIVINYEKFRIDLNELKTAFKGQRVFFCFDEGPMMLKNTRNTAFQERTESLKSMF